MKELVGKKAAEYVESGMTVGLGTGSTAYYFVRRNRSPRERRRTRNRGSNDFFSTKKQAEALGIPLKSVDEVDYIDVTIDGADEIAPDFSGIKGGGGALLFEKNRCRTIKECYLDCRRIKNGRLLRSFPITSGSSALWFRTIIQTF